MLQYLSILDSRSSLYLNKAGKYVPLDKDCYYNIISPADVVVVKPIIERELIKGIALALVFSEDDVAAVSPGAGVSPVVSGRIDMRLPMMRLTCRPDMKVAVDYFMSMLHLDIPKLMIDAGLYKAKPSTPSAAAPGTTAGSPILPDTEDKDEEAADAEEHADADDDDDKEELSTSSSVPPPSDDIMSTDPFSSGMSKPGGGSIPISLKPGTSLTPSGPDEEKFIAKISEFIGVDIVKPKETLADYVAEDYLLEELQEVVGFFNDYEEYVKAKIAIPHGVLLIGHPGTGKTYAARCIAGSANCFFMPTTASSLQGMYIGSGADKLKKLFKGARALVEQLHKQVLIFIDEIDSFGSREHHDGGAGGEEDRTVNQLLAEMSGIMSLENIIVLGATNFSNRLDPALMRSGRFSRQITIPLPTDDERLKLLTYYYRDFKLEHTLSIDQISALIQDFTPADIKELANESAILALRKKAPLIKLEHINESINRIITKNIRHKVAGLDSHRVAVHECGHVIAEIVYCHQVPLKVTIASYGDTGGFTQNRKKDDPMPTGQDLINTVKDLLGGRAAEATLCGTISVGASNDLERAIVVMTNYFKVYHFEAYDLEKLNQLVLDRIHKYLIEVEDDFKTKYRKELVELTKDLEGRETLYSSDISAVVGHLMAGSTGGTLL